MSQLFILHDPDQAKTALAHFCKVAADLVKTGKKLQVRLTDVTRSGEQNAKLHAMLSDIADQTEWAGKKRDIDTWKRLLVAAWSRAKSDPLEYLPALDGHGVDIVFTKTSGLSVSKCADLIEFIHAWAADQGLELR